MFKFIYKTITNPIIGPVAVSSIMLMLLAIFYLPTLSLQNQKDKIVQESLSLINDLKTFRSYYSDNVVDKLKNITNISIDYNHDIASNTIPLPATTIHNLSERLTKERGINVNFFSDYPFPFRADRVLDKYQKESITFLRANPNEIFLKEDFIDNKKVYRVAVSDILTSPSCVSCHNTRIDTPKNDWKLGDVRGVLEVVIPLQNQFLLNSEQSKLIIIFMLFVILAFLLHYGILFLNREKEIKLQTKILGEEVEKRTKDLNNSNLLLLEYKKAVDASAIVSKADLKGIITYVNDIFCELSGYKKEELIGKPHNIVRHPDMPKELFKELWKTIQSKKIFKGIIKNKAKNGEIYYVASTIVPILDNNAEIIEYLSLRYDITELVEAKEKAEIAQKVKSIFLANMSHEIRTPLNAIIGFSDILCESNIANEEKENAKIISRSAKSLLNIINDVLDISKMENGKFELEEKEFSLFNLTEHIVELFSINAKDKNIKFVYNVDPHLPQFIITDSNRLQQVLSNLLSNAIKFTPEYGKVYFDIKVLSSTDKNSQIKFTIKDSGIGISAEQQTNIFKPFSQGDSGISRKFGGTGLGLAICWDIVNLLGSEIKVNSELEKGSEFTFVLDCNIGNTIDDISKADINFAICKIDEDEDNIEICLKNYLEKIGKLVDITKETDDKVDILFCFNHQDLSSKLKIFKEHNKNSKIVFVGDKKKINDNLLKYINYNIDLPIYGSKIYNIIADNSDINNIVLEKSTTNQKLEGKILVAEDNPNNQKLIELLLAKLGLTSVIVFNGEEVIEAYKKSKFDLILMDINMPVMNGLTATGIIKGIQKDYYNISIIALTANSIAGDKEKYLEQGMDDYLSKPIEYDKLVSIFKKYLQKNDDNNIKENLPKDETTLFDKNLITQRLGLDESTVDMLLDNFLLTLDNDLQNIQKALEEKNTNKISQTAHYLKGACANLAMDKVVEILEYIELNANNLEEDFSLTELRKLFENIKNSLKDKNEKYEN